MECEFPESNPSDSEVKGIIENYKTIAVVGISKKENRDSYQVAQYLKEHGYRIIPVNPKLDEVLGEKAYPDLKSIPFPIDIVDIFRKPEAIPRIVEEAILIGAKAIWMQLGLAHNESARKAREKGLKVVMNKCIKVEHKKHLGQ